MFGDFSGSALGAVMRAFGMCVRESLKDESCVRESRKKGRVGTCANTFVERDACCTPDARNKGLITGKEMSHRRHVIVCGKKTLVPEG